MADVVLVHGTTQTATGWNRLVDVLKRRGHRPWAVELHGADPTSTAAQLGVFAAQQLPGLANPVVVAHSGSGLLLPAIGEALGARHEVYLAAAVPDPAGQRSFLAETEATQAAGFNREWVGVDPTSDSVLATHFLFHDCDLATLRWALSTLGLFRAIASAYAETPSAQDLTLRPSSYLLPRSDRTLRPDYMQQLARERLGVEPVVLEGGHCPHVSRPGDVADHIDSLQE